MPKTKPIWQNQSGIQKYVYAAFFLLAVSIEAIADQPLLKAALAETDYPPFYFVDNDKLTGISIDVLNEIATKTGYEIKYKRFSWPRVLKELENGSSDLVTTFFNTAERAPFVVYTGIPHAYEESRLFTLAGQSTRFDGSMKSLAEYRIGTIRGYSYGKVFDSAEYLMKEPVLDEPTLVRMMLGKRFDMAIGNPYAINLQAQKMKSANRLQYLEPAVDRSPIYMAVSRKNSQALEIAAKITAAIYEIKKTEKYQQWLKKYDM